MSTSPPLNPSDLDLVPPCAQVEDAAVSSWEAGTTVLGPKSYDLVLSEQVLVPGMQVTVRLNLETAWDRSIGDTVDIDTARRELLCLELGVLRKHVSAPDTALGDLFSGEWRAQLPRVRSTMVPIRTSTAAPHPARSLGGRHQWPQEGRPSSLMLSFYDGGHLGHLVRRLQQDLSPSGERQGRGSMTTNDEY